VSDIKLFSLDGGKAQELPGSSVALEKSLQDLMEANLEPLLGLRFLASEHSTGARHGGRIDSLAIDENGSPVIIEYKRTTNENVINQGLFYLDWLMDHRSEFELLVMKQLGQEAAEKLDWSAPRLLCIAGGFTRYDEHAVQQMGRSIDLIRYRRFVADLLLLELVNATTSRDGAMGEATKGAATRGVNTIAYKSVSQIINELDQPIRDLYEELRAYLLALGDDVNENILKLYVAFKTIKNFACVDVQKGSLLLFLKLDPAEMTLEEGFTRDVREIGHWGTGDLQVTLRTQADLERAKVLIQQTYEAS
jgi:predicted transport protein